MKSFLHRFHERILGVLSGFDRIRFRGTLLRLASVSGLSQWLASKRVPLKDFTAPGRGPHPRNSVRRSKPRPRKPDAPWNISPPSPTRRPSSNNGGNARASPRRPDRRLQHPGELQLLRHPP